MIPDYGGKHETFTVAQVAPGHHLVYTLDRGHTELRWAIVLTPYGEREPGCSCVSGCTRSSGRWLAHSVGEPFDALTMAGMAAGLKERLNRLLHAPSSR